MHLTPCPNKNPTILFYLPYNIMSKLDNLIKQYKAGDGELISILEEVIRSEGYISFERLSMIGAELEIPLAKLYGVATFYSFLPTAKCGKNIIRVCASPTCHLKGSKDLLDFLKKELKIGLGGTTADGRFTLEKTSCLGQCDKSPAIMINDKVYTNLNKAKIREMLGKLK
jgi:NADH-quinone oxidoreductase subunit E